MTQKHMSNRVMFDLRNHYSRLHEKEKLENDTVLENSLRNFASAFRAGQHEGVSGEDFLKAMMAVEKTSQSGEHGLTLRTIEARGYELEELAGMNFGYIPFALPDVLDRRDGEGRLMHIYSPIAQKIVPATWNEDGSLKTPEDVAELLKQWEEEEEEDG